MKLRLPHILFIIFLALLVLPVNGSTRCKGGKVEKGIVALNLVEPDMLAAKAKQEGAVLPILAVNLEHKAKTDPRFREGIDVSHYQGQIDWDQVAGSQLVSYVYLKATEGRDYVDDTYARNLVEARRVGLSVGSYHFYRPNVSWEEQFRNLTTLVKPGEQDLVPMIDIEHRGHVSEAKFIADIKKFLLQVEQHYGKKPLLYTYQNFYNKHFKGLFQDYHWMIAKYQENEPLLEDGRDFIMWQYTQSGSVPGVDGNVDRSCIMGNFTLDVLKQ